MRSGSSWYLQAPISSLDNPVIKQYCLSHSTQVRTRRYPLRLLRYWFMHQLLQQEARQRGPLRVCEIGVDRGQMLHFAREAASVEATGESQPWLAAWDAVDVHLRNHELYAAGYRNLFRVDLEQDEVPQELHRHYDVVILLHVLEHLHDPEAALGKALQCLKPGGIVIGGMPVLPQALLSWREAALRRTARAHGHVSAFSPQRVKAWSVKFGLQEELCRGAFFLRSKNLPLEDRGWWVRFNLGFGARFPAWPGELYWCFRRPLQLSDAAANLPKKPRSSPRIQEEETVSEVT